MTPATRELLASQDDAWGFLSEPYHLSDWWPGLLSVEPDRRGFAAGARWRVRMVADPLRIWILRLPGMGRPSGPDRMITLVITAIEPCRRWSFALCPPVKDGKETAVRPRSVEIELRPLAPDRTEAAVTVATGSREELHIARAAVDRLYDLVQMAATL